MEQREGLEVEKVREINKGNFTNTNRPLQMLMVGACSYNECPQSNTTTYPHLQNHPTTQVLNHPPAQTLTDVQVGNPSMTFSP